MKTFDDLDERDEDLFTEWFTTADFVPPATLDEAVDLWWMAIRQDQIRYNGIFWRDE